MVADLHLVNVDELRKIVVVDEGKVCGHSLVVENASAPGDTQARDPVAGVNYDFVVDFDPGGLDQANFAQFWLDVT